MLKILPVCVQGETRSISTFALLDDGSTITLIDEGLTREINVRGEKVDLRLKTVQGEAIAAGCEKVNLTVTGAYGNFELQGAMTVKDLPLPSQSLSEELLNQLNGWVGKRHLSPYLNARARLLIGQDNWKLLVSRDIIVVEHLEVALSCTPLGWVVHGTPRYQAKVSRVTAAQSNLVESGEEIHGDRRSGRTGRVKVRKPEPSDLDAFGDAIEPLDHLMREYFEIDSLGVRCEGGLKTEHDRALAILGNTSRKVDTHWETGLLWKQEVSPGINSLPMARRRLDLLEKKLDRDSKYADLYYSEMQRFLDKGYAKKIEKPTGAEREWYLPHFGVVNANKPGRIRLVFDAAAKSKGVSLNDQLEAGPDLLQSLPAILIRFRQYKIAFKGDITDMFLRVRVRPEDRGAQRFLWRGKKRDVDPDVYEMSSLIFGAKSSPCSAIYIKNENARSFSVSHPEASRSIVRDSYMDDFLGSSQDDAHAARLVRDVVKINKQANFEMHGWASNSATVLRAAAVSAATEGGRRSTRLREARLCDKSDERVLGLVWDADTDELKFNLGFTRISRDILSGDTRPSKREVLRVIMSVFDPLGLLSPFTLKSKILMQEIWRSGIYWDTKLRDDEYEAWREWVSKLDDARECTIPRCLTPKHDQGATAQLHVFCDASLVAYAAAAYARFIAMDGSIRVALIMAKSRVAPLKPALDIPKLELQAALVGARLMKFIGEEIDFKVTERFMWTDNSAVLYWIRSEPRARKVFYANRLGEIGEITKVSEWRWVPSKQNPADDATRFGNNVLKEGKRWFWGPEFLYKSESDWPAENALLEEDQLRCDALISRSVFASTALPVATPSLALRLAGWWGLLVIARRVRRAFTRWKERAAIRKFSQGECTVAKILSEEYWFRVIQADAFGYEVKVIKSKGKLGKSSKIASLTPTIGNDGLIRANGRVTSAAAVGFNNHPIVLEGSHFATKLLIADYHRRYYHGSTETVVNEIRQKYYIIGLRNALRSIAARCIVCRLRRGRPMNPVMAPLPSCRTAVRQRPFSHCGLDYFGPMWVKIGRRREKRWGVLFTCLTTRAVALDLAHSLSSSSAIMALQRLSSERGQPMIIYSDNGTNFRGASKELRNAILTLDHDKIINFAAGKGIEWRFNPPDAPHMGGAWERLVRSVKRALDTTLKDQAPCGEVLITVLKEIQHSVNSRPLTHVSVDPRDQEALTPNHFLIGTSSSSVNLGNYDASWVSPRRQYRLVQHYAELFWKRWLREYLPTLLPRNKWREDENPIKIGDIVLIIDLQAPRNQWRKGVVIRVVPSDKDGVVRIAEIRTSAGTYTRATRKLVKIFGDDDVQD